jgi:hypothetical protein
VSVIGGQAHNNLMPHLTLNRAKLVVIAYQSGLVTPSRASR